MNSPLPALTAILAFAFTAGGPALQAAETSPSTASIARFQKVDDHLYRGGQPDERGFRYLKELGVRTVISLRNETDEKALVESLGMKWVQIPLTFRAFGGEDFSATDVKAFFDAIDQRGDDAVFFHCKRGADRTGTFAALYRVARQGWQVDRAYQEARDAGMRWWYTGVKDKVRAFATQIAPLAPAE